MPSEKVISKSDKKGKNVEKSEKVDKAKVEGKKNKYSDVKTGDAPNKQTAFAGFTFNVKHVHKWLSEYLKRYTYKSKDKDGNDTEQCIKVLNGHFSIGATDHVLCLAIANLVASHSKKSTASLNTITEENIINSVRLDNDFSSTFGKFLDKYDSHETYGSQLNLNKKDVLDYISTHGFLGGSNSFHFESGAYNFLTFLMLKNRILLTETSVQLALYANKKSVDDRAILFALKTVYTGKLFQSLYKRVEEISHLVRGLKSDKDDKSKDTESLSDGSDNELSSSDDKKKRNSNKKVDKKTDKHKKKHEETESESESESDNESNVSDDESE
jgi:hypothetical protein